MRMKNETWPRQIIIYIPSNKRANGRPRTLWWKRIEKVMRRIEMNKREWENRREFMSAVAVRPRIIYKYINSRGPTASVPYRLAFLVKSKY